MTTEEFIRRAKDVHGQTYDYSDVIYVNMKHKVKIRCFEHGIFEQLPQPHLKGQGCPVCGRKKCKLSMLSKYGVDNPMKVNEICEKARNTCQERYGSRWAMSNENVKNKVTATNQERYGVDRPLQNSEIWEKSHQTVLSTYGCSSVSQVPEFREKARKTCELRYGVAEPLSSPIVRDKIKETNNQRYGGNAPMCSVDIQNKCKNTVMNKYGVGHITQAESVKNKIFASKSVRGTFSSSESEDELYQMLCSYFGENDVLRNYSSVDYLFACDFYIKSRNLYIELNAHWTHGGHWFDKNALDDVKIIDVWTERNTKYYRNAIHVWTIKDVEKRAVAQNNHLNYVVFWDSALRDSDLWFSMGCPDGQDWKYEYSWMDI